MPTVSSAVATTSTVKRQSNDLLRANPLAPADAVTVAIADRRSPMSVAPSSVNRQQEARQHRLH